jgi:putative ABC transport system permease protein
LQNKLVVANLCHRPVRTLLSLLAIGVEVTMILTLVGLSYGTLHGAARRARGVGADILVRPSGASLLNLSSAPMSDRFLSFFMSQPHVTFAVGTVILPISGFDSITGLDLEQFKKLSGGFRFLEGGPFTGDADVIVDEYYAREKNLHVGSTLDLVNHAWRVAGIFESGKLARICTKLSVAQDLNSSPDKLSQIYLKLDDPHRAQAVVQQLRSKLPGYGIYTVEEFTSLLSLSSVGLLKDFIGVVISVAGVVGFIVVFMAMYTAVLERTREIGILKAVGASPGYILNLLFRESLGIAIAGAAVGILMTYGTQFLVEHTVPASLVQETVYWWWPIASGIAIGGALLGTVVPAIKALQQDATDALAYE